jgi:VIT1/CCC1 family predicted Fe2+/Mn2+ transporter
VLSALVLFGVGAYQALTLVDDWRKKGLQMVVIGLGAAAIGFAIGRLFHTAGAWDSVRGCAAAGRQG